MTVMTTLHQETAWILALLLVGCAKSPDGDRNRIVAQHQDEAPVVQRVDGGSMTATPGSGGAPSPPAFVKVVAVDMTVDKDGAVRLKNPRVQYGEAPNQIGNPPMFTAVFLDRQGAVVISVPLWDPRWTFVWSDEKDRDSVELSESADAVVIVPFRGNLATMNVVRAKESLASIDLTQAIEAFCAKHREDPDCRATPPVKQPEL